MRNVYLVYCVVFCEPLASTVIFWTNIKLLTKKIHKQGYASHRLNKSFRVKTMTWLAVMENRCYKFPRIGSVCRNHSLSMDSFTNYYKSNTRSRNCWSFRNTWVHPRFIGVCVAHYVVFCVVFCRSLFVVLSVFVWPCYCLSFFDLRLLIFPLFFSNTNSLPVTSTWGYPRFLGGVRDAHHFSVLHGVYCIAFLILYVLKLLNVACVPWLSIHDCPSNVCLSFCSLLFVHSFVCPLIFVF